MGERFAGQFGLGLDQFIYQDLNTLRSSYDSLNLIAGLVYTVSDFGVSLRSLIQFKEYERGSEEEADRADRLSESSLQFNYKFSESMDLFQRNTFIHNASTYELDDDNRSYQQWQHIIGLYIQI